ncbi:heavy metal translocating P-type ATPase [Flavobacteriaceae bacterium Ap0902]|nr:heavy metal translocating P-type ATPase [Flavobacteriaceae bacterium Ap0902]
MSASCCSIEKRDHHEHEHLGMFGENTELIFAILSGVFFLIGLAIEHLLDVPALYYKISFSISLFFGAYFIFFESIERVLKGIIEIDFLMLAAAAGAIYIDRWGEAALLLFLFSLGHALEHFAMNKARKNIEVLGELSPKVALLKTKEGSREVPIEDLVVNDIILVPPHTKIAADGVIINGSSSVNQASITGESMPVEKSPIESAKLNIDFETMSREHKVYSGSINGDHALEVKVLKLSKDSTISRMIEMVSNIDGTGSKTQVRSKKFEKWYVPTVIIFVVLLCFAFLVLDETYNESIYRAITVLVAASPCALAISTPSAVLSGVARAARNGVLIKGGKALEDLGDLRTIAFDKTGTLTEGKPKLTHLEVLNQFDRTLFMQIVVDVESLSNHPLARAIVSGLQKDENIYSENKAENIEAIQGLGIKAFYNGKQVLIGNEQLMNTHQILVSNSIQSKMEKLISSGETTMLVAYQNLLIGIVSVMDLPREMASSTLKALKEIGIENMIMLTGDHPLIGNAIADKIGLTEAQGDLLPEDKVAAITKLKDKYGEVAMVGDGVNDAPAMANATVGVAMGAAGSDVALETADVALMSDKIEKLPFVIDLSRAAKRIIRQNIWISMGMVAVLVPATLFGIAEIGPAVVFHEGSTLLVVLNALRLLKYKQD